MKYAAPNRTTSTALARKQYKIAIKKRKPIPDQGYLEATFFFSFRPANAPKTPIGIQSRSRIVFRFLEENAKG